MFEYDENQTPAGDSASGPTRATLLPNPRYRTVLYALVTIPHPKIADLPVIPDGL